MRVYRRRELLLLLLIAGAGTANAQVPVAVDFPNDAGSAAMGSADVASWGALGATSRNSAVAGTIGGLTLQSALSSSRGADETGFSLRGSIPAGPLGLAVEYQHKAIGDLIEDPGIDESGFSVSDNSFRVAVARRVGEKVSFGGGVTLGWSDVLDTRGTSRSFDAGVIARPVEWLSLGGSVRRVGGSLDWSLPGGSSTSIDVPTSVRFGARYRGFTLGQLVVGFAGDVEAGSGLQGTGTSVGVETQFRSLMLFRTGINKPAGADAYWTAGIGLRFSGIDAALSYELVNIIGPRLQLQVGLRPSAL